MKNQEAMIGTVLDDVEVWRADSGFWHVRGATVGDVINFETEELGNDNHYDPSLIAEIAHLPARRVVWVRFKKTHARRYGNPESMVITGRIIGCDGDNGYHIFTAE